ncbi:hypothetical protein [Fusobacterium sp.]|uniref:hypothetical protein n=1 Tax=Fusobacterium sp. TaxID=68766 RepID=UPI00261255BD|nr:hypothetical protein [Fusobacterium sp.]
MKVYIALLLVITGAIWATHNNCLMDISKLEKEVSAEKKNLEGLKKSLNDKQLEYDKIADLKSLELEMRQKRNMEVSSEINYFKINKNFNN